MLDSALEPSEWHNGTQADGFEWRNTYQISRLKFSRVNGEDGRFVSVRYIRYVFAKEGLE